MITPEQLAKPHTEHAEQCALFCWAAMNAATYPSLHKMFAIPNGGQRGDGTERGAKIAGGRLKAEGVKGGVPDVMLPVARIGIGGPSYFGLFIEMKRPSSKNKRAGVVAEHQSDFAKGLMDEGYKCVVCYSWEEARYQILTYLGATTTT